MERATLLPGCERRLEFIPHALDAILSRRIRVDSSPRYGLRVPHFGGREINSVGLPGLVYVGLGGVTGTGIVTVTGGSLSGAGRLIQAQRPAVTAAPQARPMAHLP